MKYFRLNALHNLLKYRLQLNAAVRLQTFDCLHPSDMLIDVY